MGSNDLDDLDLKILKTLLADARSSFTKIAKDCDVATNVIAKRFQRLKQKGIITGTAIITNLPTSELPHRLSVDLKVRSDAINEIIDEYKKNPLFRVAFRTIGAYDLHLAIGVRSLVEAERIREDLRRKKGVSEVIVSASLDSTIFLPENLSIK